MSGFDGVQRRKGHLVNPEAKPELSQRDSGAVPSPTDTFILTRKL